MTVRYGKGLEFVAVWHGETSKILSLACSLITSCWLLGMRIDFFDDCHVRTEFVCFNGLFAGGRIGSCSQVYIARTSYNLSLALVWQRRLISLGRRLSFSVIFMVEQIYHVELVQTGTFAIGRIVGLFASLYGENLIKPFSCVSVTAWCSYFHDWRHWKGLEFSVVWHGGKLHSPFPWRV